MTNAHAAATTLRSLQHTSFIVGIGSALLCAPTAYFLPRSFFPAYLVAFLFWLGLSLGSLAIGMLHHLTGGSWGVAIRRIVDSAAAVLLLLTLLFLPIVVGMRYLYVWTDPELMANDEVLRAKSGYLNSSQFLIRAALYFGIWLLWSFVLLAATATSNLEIQQRRRRFLATFSGWGLVFWGLTVTFASIDWAMSLEPHWYSSMYGVLFMAGQGVSAMALATLAAIFIRWRVTKINLLTTGRQQDLANFLLAFVMFWSYVSLMQFLIIWSANLPEETPRYLARSRGGWQFIIYGLVILHFLVPFLVLLLRESKRNTRRFVSIACLLLVMRFADLCWLILPPFIPSPLIGNGREVIGLWPLLLTMPAIGGLWIALFSFHLSRRVHWPVAETLRAPEQSHVSAPHHTTQVDEDAVARGYELRDVKPGIILSLTGAISVLVLISIIILWQWSRATRSADARGDTQDHPDELIRTAPLLQTSPIQDYARFAANQERILTTYGWSDREKRIVRIPIERAMEIALERGLPKPKVITTVTPQESNP